MICPRLRVSDQVTSYYGSVTHQLNLQCDPRLVHTAEGRRGSGHLREQVAGPAVKSLSLVLLTGKWVSSSLEGQGFSGWDSDHSASSPNQNFAKYFEAKRKMKISLMGKALLPQVQQAAGSMVCK